MTWLVAYSKTAKGELTQTLRFGKTVFKSRLGDSLSLEYWTSVSVHNCGTPMAHSTGSSFRLTDMLKTSSNENNGTRAASMTVIPRPCASSCPFRGGGSRTGWLAPKYEGSRHHPSTRASHTIGERETVAMQITDHYPPNAILVCRSQLRYLNSCRKHFNSFLWVVCLFTEVMRRRRRHVLHKHSLTAHMHGKMTVISVSASCIRGSL